MSTPAVSWRGSVVLMVAYGIREMIAIRSSRSPAGQRVTGRVEHGAGGRGVGDGERDQYLTCWRLCLASDLLRDTDHTLAVVARQVGYANAYALSAAFTRFYGVRPGEFRTQAA